MSVLDRQLQLQILNRLHDEYPEFVEVNKFLDANDRKIQANLFYLAEHGLIEPGAIREAFGVPRMMTLAKITSRGLDFLEDDGGLGAILRVVTVRFDAENIKTLLEEKILHSNISDEQKKSVIHKLKSFSGEILKSIILKLVEKGIEKPEDIARFIDMILKI